MPLRSDRSAVLGAGRWARLAAAALWPLLAAAQAPTSVTPRSSPPAAQVPARAAQPAGFVPEGWELEQQKVADLNGDGLADALLLMRRPQASGTPQRMLAAVLRERGGNAGYALAELNRRLIPHGEGVAQEDPMADGEIIARRGGFDVKLTLLAGMGSYQTATLRYRFRYEDSCFRLIGYDRMETHRATLDTRDLSINFLTGAVVRRTGNAQSDATEERREKLKTNPRRCFGELDSAPGFNP
jgi:hypothetical protein